MAHLFLNDVYYEYGETWGELFDLIDYNFDLIKWHVNQDINNRLDAIDGDIGQIWGDIIALWNTIGAGFQDDIIRLDSDIDILWNRVFNVIGDRVLFAENDITTLFNSINNHINPFLDALDSDVNIIWEEIFTFIPQDMADLRMTVTQQLAKALDDLDKRFDLLMTSISSIIINLNSELDAEIRSIKDFVTTEFSALDTLLQGQIDVNRVYMNETRELLDGLIANDVNVIFDNIDAILNSIVPGIDKKILAVSTRLDNEFIPLINNIDNKLITMGSLIDNNVLPRITSVEHRIGELYATLNSRFNFVIDALFIELDKAVKPLELAIDAVRLQSLGQFKAIEETVTRRINELNISVIEQQNILRDAINDLDREFSAAVDNPLSLLLAVLTNKNGIYTAYQQLWQRFVTKLIRA